MDERRLVTVLLYLWTAVNDLNVMQCTPLMHKWRGIKFTNHSSAIDEKG